MTATAVEERTVAPPNLMQPSREKPLFRLRRRRDHGTPPPPVDHERIHTGHHRCDECHVAEARYEVVTRGGFLYFCGHHFKKRFAWITEKRYSWRPL